MGLSGAGADCSFLLLPLCALLSAIEQNSTKWNCCVGFAKWTCAADFLLTPCSRETFKIIYGDEDPHQGCQGNLEAALAPFGIGTDDIPVAFNCFMNVVIQPATGAFTVEAPLSRSGDFISFRAQMDLVVGLTACSALQSNNYAFKPIAYLIG